MTDYQGWQNRCAVYTHTQFIYICMCEYIYIYIYMHVGLYSCCHVCIYIYACMYMLYTHMLQLYQYAYIYIYTYAEYILTQWIKMSEDFFIKYTSHFIVRFACERDLETEQRLQYIDLPSPSGHSRVSFSFSWTSQPGAWGPSLSGTCSHPSIFSPTGLISNSLTSCLTKLYNSSIAHSIFGMACLLVIKRK